MLWLLVGSTLTTSDAMQNVCKSNNFKTNSDLEDHEGGSQEKAAAKKERLRLKAEWEWLYQEWNVKTGIMKSGVTNWEKAEKEII